MVLGHDPYADCEVMFQERGQYHTNRYQGYSPYGYGSPQQSLPEQCQQTISCYESMDSSVRCPSAATVVVSSAWPPCWPSSQTANADGACGQEDWTQYDACHYRQQVQQLTYKLDNGSSVGSGPCHGTIYEGSQRQQQHHQCILNASRPLLASPSSACSMEYDGSKNTKDSYQWINGATQNMSDVHHGKTRTKEKYRVVYTDHQRLELEKEFIYNRYITIRRKAELAAGLSLSERQVKIWFQNRRAKERKLNKKKAGATNKTEDAEVNSPAYSELCETLTPAIAKVVGDHSRYATTNNE